MLDYKDIRDFERRKRLRQRKKKLLIIAASFLLIIITVFLAYQIEKRKIIRLQEYLISHNFLEFDELSSRGFFFFNQEKKELLFIYSLLQNKVKEEFQLKKNSSLKREKILKMLFDSGNYSVFAAYLSKLNFLGDSLQLYRLLAALSFYNLAEAQDIFLKFKQNRDYQQYRQIVEQRIKELKSKRIPLIFDCRNKVIGRLNLETRKIEPEIPGFYFSSALEKRIKNEWRRIYLTINSDWQQLLEKLFMRRKFRGGFLLAELQSAAVRIAYSSTTQKMNTIFEEYFEPASIIKCLTYLAFLKFGKSNFFPVYCNGNIAVAGKIFYDWMKHGKVDDAENALAVSCNVTFAEMAAKIGHQKLKETFIDFNFDRQPDQDFYFSFNWGRFRNLENNILDIYKAGVGLEKEELTLWHALWLAAAFARNGRGRQPFLVDTEYNLLQVGYYSNSLQKNDFVVEGYDYGALKKAMRAVVESEQGTLKKLRHPAWQIAAKTGTGGKKDPDYDAVIIGFFPAEAPRYAFALLLRKAGRADRNAADFLKDFFDVWSENN